MERVLSLTPDTFSATKEEARLAEDMTKLSTDWWMQFREQVAKLGRSLAKISGRIADARTFLLSLAQKVFTLTFG